MSRAATKRRVRAKQLNPAGISHRDAIRALHDAGYSERQVAEMVEIVGADAWGAAIWRWRRL